MRIVLTDDHKVVRDGLRWMLSDEPDVEIVGEAASGRELLDILDTTPVDVVLLDVRMPDLSGLEVLEAIPERSPETRVVIMSMHDEPAYVRRAVELGAAGYLLKSAQKEEILQALRVVEDGGAYIQSELTGTLMGTISGRERVPAGLSPREEEILRLVSEGLENKQIATRLGISEATVKTHLKGVFSRLDVSSRAEAVAVALRLGVID